MRTLMFLRRRKPVPDLEKQRLWCDHDWYLWRMGDSGSLAVDTSKVFRGMYCHFGGQFTKNLSLGPVMLYKNVSIRK